MLSEPSVKGRAWLLGARPGTFASSSGKQEPILSPYLLRMRYALGTTYWVHIQGLKEPQ